MESNKIKIQDPPMLKIKHWVLSDKLGCGSFG